MWGHGSSSGTRVTRPRPCAGIPGGPDREVIWSGKLAHTEPAHGGGSLIPSPLVLGQARSYQARASKVVTHALAAQGKAATSLSSRRKPLRSHSHLHRGSGSALMISSHA